jgi:predicted phosphodiesterase
MLILIVSDIHANIHAFDAVLGQAGEFDKIWCLGDVVGYGPNPNECIDRLREFPHSCVLGNHDSAALGRLDLNDFNSDAQASTLWTRQQLSADSTAYLESLPERQVEDNVTFVHGSPREPVWEYIMFPAIAKAQFNHFATDVCFVGHTHAPVVFSYFKSEAGLEVCEASVLPQENKFVVGNERQIINPGSVGQPRDGDPRAAYALLDTETKELEHFRVEYSIEEVQATMRQHSLPPRLIARLTYGW